MVASEGRQVAVGLVESVTFKDGVKAVVQVPLSSEYRHNLADSVKKEVLIICTGIEELQGEKAPAVTEPDQLEIDN